MWVMCRLAKIFVVMVSLMVLNFSFAQEREFTLYNEDPSWFNVSVTIITTPLRTGCMGIDKDNEEILIGDECTSKNIVFEVESWEECKESCSELDGDKGRKKCIAFWTAKKMGSLEKLTVCCTVMV
jgi:hypothetical protein